MQPLKAAMSKVRQAFYAALLKSLLRTKSWLRTLLQFWIVPSLLTLENGDQAEDLQKRRDVFLKDVKTEFEREMTRDRLVAFSNGLRLQLEGSLLEHPMCMLPSYNHQLPTGDEIGNYLALDVGGSTFRLALVGLAGKKVDGKECQILKSKSVKVDSRVRALKGVLFFDWMAERIEDMLSQESGGQEMSGSPLSMGLSWSFPIQ
jgi:hexokinase